MIYPNILKGHVILYVIVFIFILFHSHVYVCIESSTQLLACLYATTKKRKAILSSMHSPIAISYHTFTFHSF